MKGFDVVWSCFEQLENQALCCDAPPRFKCRGLWQRHASDSNMSRSKCRFWLTATVVTAAVRHARKDQNAAVLLDTYKYKTSFQVVPNLSSSIFPILRIFFQERKNSKNSFLFTQINSFLHQTSYSIFYAHIGQNHAWVLVNTHPLVCISLLSYIISVLLIKEISFIICMLLEYILDTKQRLLC